MEKGSVEEKDHRTSAESQGVPTSTLCKGSVHLSFHLEGHLFSVIAPQNRVGRVHGYNL